MQLRDVSPADKAEPHRQPVSLRTVSDSLDRLYPLGDDDRAAIDALPFRTVDCPANHFLVREGQRPEYCAMLLSGYTCRHKLAANGLRQNVSFQIPGDVLDAQQLEFARADHNLQTITAATVALVMKQDVQQLVDRHPTIRHALWRGALIEASIFREWVLNVGRREGIARVAHVLCEFAVRRQAAKLGPPDRFELPMTQEQIADATGLTPVHVNRMMQALGALGVIERNKRQVTIVNWDRMREVADFDPAYLHIA